MTAPLSNDLRRRVVKAIERGLSRRAAAAKFDISVASAVRWYQRFKRTGSIEPDAIGGDHHSHRAEAHAARILEWIDEQRDLTLVEIRDRLAEEGACLCPRHDLAFAGPPQLHGQKRLPMPASRSATM